MQKIFQNIAKAYMISGDSNGLNGLRNNTNRVNRIYNLTDNEQIASDWARAGDDMRIALEKYDANKVLIHG